MGAPQANIPNPAAKRVEAGDAAKSAYVGKATAISSGIVSHVDTAAKLHDAGVFKSSWIGAGGVRRQSGPAGDVRRVDTRAAVAKGQAIDQAATDTRGIAGAGFAHAVSEQREAISSGSGYELEDEVMAETDSQRRSAWTVVDNPVTQAQARKRRADRREARAARTVLADDIGSPSAVQVVSGKPTGIPSYRPANNASTRLEAPVANHTNPVLGTAKAEVPQAATRQVPQGTGRIVEGTQRTQSRRVPRIAPRYGHSAAARSAAMRTTQPQVRKGAVAVARSVGTKVASMASSAIAALGTPLAAGLIGFVTLLLVIAVIIGGITQPTHTTDLLDEIENQVASYLYDIGFGDAQVAGVLAHIQCESGFDPANEFEFGGQGGYSYEVACGLLQYTSTSPGQEEYFEYKNWCTATGRDWTDVDAQLYWTFGSHEPPGYWEGRWINRTGYYRAACEQDYPKGNALQVTVDAFLQTEDPQEACYLFMAGYGGGTQNPSQLHLARRLAAAQSYYAKLTGTVSGGKPGVVAEAMKHLGKAYVWGAEGPNSFDCSGFTMYCYRVALGISIPHYTEDQYAAATAIVAPEQAEPGDILYKPGHVGISLGGIHAIEAMGARWGVVESNRSAWTAALKFT